MPAQRRVPSTVSGVKRPSRASQLARPWRPAGAATRSTGRRRIDASPSSVQRPVGWPASQPGSRRSSVPALPTSIAAPGAAPRRPGAADRRARRAPRSSTGAPSAAHRGERRARVGRVEVARDPHRRRRSSRPSSAARWEIDLSGGATSAPRSGAGRARKRDARSCAAPPDSRARPASVLGASAARARSPSSHRRDRARGVVGGGRERHVDDVDARLAERERELGDRRPAGWAPRRAAPPRALTASSASQQPRGAPRRAPSFHAATASPSPAAQRGAHPRPAAPRCRRSRRRARRRWRGRCRARSRCSRRPRASCRGSSARWRAAARPRPRAPARPARRARWRARAGRWETTASTRSWVSASSAAGRAPRRGEQPVQALVQRAAGARRRRQVPRGAVEELRAGVARRRPSRRRPAGARR